MNYLVRGAILECSRLPGALRMLNLPQDHAAYSKTGHPLVHECDCKVGAGGNIPSFGICPITGAICEPDIVKEKWTNGYPAMMIADNGVDYRALTQEDSLLVCSNGESEIKPLTSGQENVGDYAYEITLMFNGEPLTVFISSDQPVLVGSPIELFYDAAAGKWLSGHYSSDYLVGETIAIDLSAVEWSKDIMDPRTTYTTARLVNLEDVRALPFLAGQGNYNPKTGNFDVQPSTGRTITPPSSFSGTVAFLGEAGNDEFDRGRSIVFELDQPITAGGQQASYNAYVHVEDSGGLKPGDKVTVVRDQNNQNVMVNQTTGQQVVLRLNIDTDGADGTTAQDTDHTCCQFFYDSYRDVIGKPGALTSNRIKTKPNDIDNSANLAIPLLHGLSEAILSVKTSVRRENSDGELVPDSRGSIAYQLIEDSGIPGYGILLEQHYPPNGVTVSVPREGWVNIYE